MKLLDLGNFLELSDEGVFGIYQFYHEVLHFKLLVQSKNFLVTVDDLQVGMRDECADHVQEYELHNNDKQIDADYWHDSTVFLYLTNTWPLLHQETPQRLEWADTLAELHEITPKLNLEHDNKACETEHEDNREVDKLIFGEFYDIKEHTDFGYIFLDEVHELENNKSCWKALAISITHELCAN